MFPYNLGMENKIKDYRKSKNITQEEMAKMLNVSRQSYINYESGDTEPSFETLKKISSILNVSIDCLLDNQEYIEKSTRRNEEFIKELQVLLEKYKH